MTERQFITRLTVGMVLWGVLIYLILTHAPRTDNPAECRKLAQPEQEKCKARRRL